MVVQLGLEGVLVDRADELLELLVRGQDQLGGGHLVEVAHLQPDDPVLHVVDDPHAVAGTELPGQLQQLDQAQPLAVQRHRATTLELDRDVLGLIRRLARVGHQVEDVVMRRLPQVLDRAPLAGAPPEVVVDRVRR